MATKFIERAGVAAGDVATILTNLAADVTAGYGPIMFDAVDGQLKYYDQLTSVVKTLHASNLTPISQTASTLTMTAALHAGRTVVLNRAGGVAVTLPLATGTGNKYRIVIGTTFTGAASIAVANASDYLVGFALLGIDGGTAVPHLYPTANTGTLATESDTISLFGTANSQGGFKGATIEIEDIATNVFQVRYVSDAGGTEATPFSAAV